ncbi:hypothetical protein BN946_scf184813.g10 [Trametes cinnabarina]|uniref:RNase H type-1 domain-containing protein n=1 Tax=Pycnoporus cinnabarinus TaxID=5643 RepID=A0A060SQU0_PYCCI|nr:hypothetical protein BN946_scf184813.g10 [Trametes cinnabarina]
MYAGSIKILHSAHPDSPTQKEGVAFVLNSKLINTTGAKLKVISPGRAAQLTIAWRGGDVRRLLCAYAPTSDGVAERRAFFKDVSAYYDQHPNVPCPHLMAGDFNNVEDSIDRLPVSLIPDPSIEDLDDLKSRLNLMLVDGWRATHPTERNYTFHRGTGDSATMSRLDRIYVNEETFHFARQWEIKQPSVKTDHHLVMVQITTPNEPEVGPGRTVFPLHLLQNKGLVKRMKARGLKAWNDLQLLEHTQTRTNDHNPQTILAALKSNWLTMVRDLEKATVPKLISEIQEHEAALKRLRGNCDLDDRQKAKEINILTAQIRDLQARRQKQRQGNSRVKYRLHGESPTKFWVNLNKSKAPRELIPAFESPEGSGRFVTDAPQMAKVARAHHNSIQQDGPDVTSPDQRERDIRTALDSLDVSVDESCAEDMAAVINHDDCEFALKYAKTGTAPGVDGIQYEVWKTLHDRFREDSRHADRASFDVLAVLQAAFADIQQNGVCASTAFAEGWMAPIWKEKGEKTKVVNYRPITVLNTDYKLLTKIMAVKLAAAAPSIVHPAQAGFVPGRKLRDQTQLARMMMLWAEAKEVNGAIVALDQEKAYDKIAHDYLWRVLERFGIPEPFITMVKSLYANAETSVMVNGAMSETYRIYRGVRQGDPLSCLLFDLAIEPLSAMIRKSNLKGFELPGHLEVLKATLFADDTTTYLTEDDKFEDLQSILNTWCSAAKAKFNISKTEIIPIGTPAYREEFAWTYKSTGRWKDYPQNVHVAGEGEPVRILGAFFGNNIGECEVWSTRLAKLEDTLKRWKLGRTTLEGKRHVAQMFVGGMTQFLTDVQRMPDLVKSRLTKILRKYIWDDKHNTPVGMAHLSLPFDQGGFKILDIESRNEAISIMWLKSYLSFGPNRPWWASLADELFAHFVPKDCSVKDPALRVNPFLQHWKPKKSALPQELKDMLTVAKKYNLRAEGLAFSRSILRGLPMWDHAQTDLKDIRKLSMASAVVTCLKEKHKLRTVGDFENLAAHLAAQDHRPTQRCDCATCERMIVDYRCSNPHRCYTRAEQFLNLLPSKWDPRGEHSEDYEESQMDEALTEGVQEATLFDRRVTTHGTEGSIFRIFTDQSPPANARLDMKLASDGISELTLATDGSCLRNGDRDAIAGAGVFVDVSHPSNLSLRIPAEIDQSNQTGEAVATYLASSRIAQNLNLVQETDSRTVMDMLTKYRYKHEDEGFLATKNGQVIAATIAALRQRKAHTAFRWVKGHNGHPRNEGADRLAGLGAAKSSPDVLSIDIPPAFCVSGASLTFMTQKLAYNVVRSYRGAKLDQRPSAAANVVRVVEDIKSACNHSIKDTTVWTSLRKKDVVRECRQFLWKTLHDAYMVGKHWLRPSMPDPLRERATCKVCNEVESLDHILLNCRARGRAEIMALLSDLWTHTGKEWPGATWGTLIGAPCLIFEGADGERLPALERLWTILTTEAVYLVWKLRCERVIQNDGREFTVAEITNRWFATINRQLTVDRLATAKFLGKRALKPDVVESAWYPILDWSNSLPLNWVGDGGVLVGIRRGQG